jgi:hypothetical protein
MNGKSVLRVVPLAIALVAGVVAVHALMGDAHAASDKRRCAHGVQACSASQVGQPCDPRNLNVICSAQSNGGYCCLAYAP